MYKNNAFAKLTNATCPLCYIDFFFSFNTTRKWIKLSKYVKVLFYSASLCNSFFPLESSPLFFLEEYMSSGALMALPGPTVAGPEPGMCGRTVGEAALLGGPDFSNGT